MNAFKIGITSALALSAIILLSVITSTSATSSAPADIKSDDAVLEIENSIIIHGLRMESGKIIELPEFGNDFKTTRETKQNKRSQKEDNIRHDEENSTGGKYLESLKKQDIRWHSTEYRIRSGDTLWDIARRFNTGTTHIIRINNIHKPDLLSPGRKITVPHRTGVRHIIRKGDTLSEIAAAYGVKTSSIIESNTLKTTQDTLRPGMELFIPGGRRKHAEKPALKHAPDSAVASIEKSIDTSRFIWPLKGRITSSFGNRIDPFSKKKSFHCGIDISAEPGTPVRASSDGKVIFSGWKEGYGNMVVLRHEGGYITVYAHNSKNMVTKGDRVKQKDIIASSGMTGAVTGAHLHFEVRKYLTPLNPLRFIKQ